MFERSVENNKHPNFEWRGQGGVRILLFSKVPYLSTMSQQFCRRFRFSWKEMHSFLRGAFSKSQNWPAGPVIFDKEIGIFKDFFFFENPSPSCILFRIWLIWLDSFESLAGQFWQMESALRPGRVWLIRIMVVSIPLITFVLKHNAFSLA